LNKLKEIGFKLSISEDEIYIKASKNLKPVNIDVLPYPFFPTDMQAQFVSLLSLVDGISIVSENIFEKRFMHVPELLRMGADITIDTNKAIIKGVKNFWEHQLWLQILEHQLHSFWQLLPLKGRAR